MRRLALVVFMVLAAAVAYRSLGDEETGTGNLTLPPPEPNESQSAPRISVRDMKGDAFELSDKGLYVLAFWSTLNRDSNEARSEVEKLAPRYADEGVSFAAVFVNGAPGDVNAPYTMLQDRAGRLASRYNVKRVPRLFVIKDGTVRFVLDGYYKGSSGEAIEEELNAALEEDS